MYNNYDTFCPVGVASDPGLFASAVVAIVLTQGKAW